MVRRVENLVLMLEGEAWFFFCGEGGSGWTWVLTDMASGNCCRPSLDLDAGLDLRG